MAIMHFRFRLAPAKERVSPFATRKGVFRGAKESNISYCQSIEKTIARRCWGAQRKIHVARTRLDDLERRSRCGSAGAAVCAVLQSLEAAAHRRHGGGQSRSGHERRAGRLCSPSESILSTGWVNVPAGTELSMCRIRLLPPRGRLQAIIPPRKARPGVARSYVSRSRPAQTTLAFACGPAAVPRGRRPPSRELRSPISKRSPSFCTRAGPPSTR